MVLYKQCYQSPIGELSLLANKEGLLGVWFLGQKYFQKGMTEEIKEQTTPVLEEAKAWLDDYFLGKCPDVTKIRLAHQGTDFQEKVWACLREIPYGETTTYGEIATHLGVDSAQAIGGAVGRNPYSILVPCHRVLGKKGQLTGYAAGIDKKMWLLAHEKASFVESRK